jgi:hypothetical protein
MAQEGAIAMANRERVAKASCPAKEMPKITRELR